MSVTSMHVITCAQQEVFHATHATATFLNTYCAVPRHSIDGMQRMLRIHLTQELACLLPMIHISYILTAVRKNMAVLAATPRIEPHVPSCSDVGTARQCLCSATLSDRPSGRPFQPVSFHCTSDCALVRITGQC